MQIIEKEFPAYKEKQDADSRRRKKPEGPILLQFGDDMGVRTHHLSDFDGFAPRAAEENILRRLPHAG